MTAQNKFSMIQILKGIGIVVPILVMLIAGYVNIMTKLTSLEEKITFGQQQYSTLCEQVRELKAKDAQLEQEIKEYIKSR